MGLAMRLCFLLLCLVSSFAAENEEDNGGLFPSIFNLATNAIIVANATCGEIGPEVYCKLVEHGVLKEPQCGVCDAKLETKRHPITNAIDGTNNWWQSPTLQNGKQFEWVTITLDLRQVYQIAYIILKAGISPRPGNWILERSVDGLHYKPWQYYAIRDSDCWDIYGIRPTVGKLQYRTDNEVLCTSQYSKLNPLENGEIHTSLVNGRPSADEPSLSLKEFTTARFVRLRLQKIRTLNADLMLLQTNNSYQDKSVTRRYFYSIKDISIGGQCICYGHAKYCPVHPVTEKHQCQCEHNTCGENCEICCPLYNQQPWKEGTKKNGAICELCQCFGHAEECYYDPNVAKKKLSLNIYGKYDGGGVCIKCQHNTIGINCERCKDGYFRPLGILHNNSVPCHECFCTGPGVTGVCVKDDSYLIENMKPGDCFCKEGFAGSTCDHCDVGYTNFPECKPCPCHTAGTIDGNTCEGDCICKKNVKGERCDSCKPGFYNLDANNPDGCSKCFCSGVSHICESNEWGIEIIRQMDDWIVTDLHQKVIYSAIPENGFLKMKTLHLTANKELFWQAPTYYLGKKLHSYGGELRVVLKYHIATDKISGSFIDGPGIILESRRQRIAYSLKPQVENEIFTLVIPLQEKGWRYFKKSGKLGRKIDRKIFLLILNDITRLLIRMRYHKDQTEGILINAEMEIATEYSNNFKKLKSVEKCQCPPDYTGLSCEYCDPGYRRINNTLFMGICQKCNCNNHADICDPFTGKCKNCLHNTAGPICNYCEVGYYGNPLFGTPEDCQRCRCPLENIENNFSPTCLTINKLYESIDFICTSCPEGYEGDKCERCSSGYFGNPMIPGSYCQLCNCTNNADMSDPHYCDQLTGQCLKCINNTAGWNCHECAENYFGNALMHNCQPCECNKYGSESNECNSSTGSCQCKLNFVGRNCDRCSDGYGNIEAGCQLCSCNREGSISKYCDPVSGQCPCKPGIFGMKCDICLDGYYNFSNKGCQWCECSVYGAENQFCDEVTGQCICRPHVTGRICDSCEEGYWNLISERGCEDCSCNITGSTSHLCDVLYGYCKCKPGIGGQFCDHCLPDYYGFSDSGCSECQPCKIPGYVCDSVSGKCVCPPNTIGRNCEKCAPFYWGYDDKLGCKPCNCNSATSYNEDCDTVTGKCLCLEGYEGRTCNKCHFAYYSFPNCLPCKCDIEGTVPTMCNTDGFCQCNENGQCPCKKNVKGIKCDECKAGTFGLTYNHKQGCLECFCFGKSIQCEEASMVWSQITGLSRKLTLKHGNTYLSTLYGLYVIPGQRGNIYIGIPDILKQPLYWMLPQEYLGDKILAYNGILQFQVTTDSNQTSDMFLQAYPLVLLQGNHRIVLIHTHFLPPVNGFYTISLNENEWQHFQNPQLAVTRATMLVALQNLQYILIRATDSPNIKEARLENVVLNVAVPIKSNLPSPYTAVGIESCICPPEYSGSSCQNPNIGYYRKHKPNYLYSRNILDLVGWAEPCPCNNRSKSCDENSGICTNCTENTDGPYCEICAQGYYGNPSMQPCLPCACPHIINSFSSTCESDETDYVCTSCEVGYIGKHCEKCSDGYYGDPLKGGGFCKSCNCNSYGSTSQICDKETGQCYCKEGILGRDCSVCQHRHLLTESKCLSCDDQCTGILLDDIDLLKGILRENNIGELNLIPWKKLCSVSRRYIHIKELNENYMKTLNYGNIFLKELISNFDLETHADLLYLRMRDISSIKLPNIIFSALEVKDDAETLFIKLNSIWKMIKNIIMQLERFGIDKNGSDLKTDDILNFGLNVLNELNTSNFMYHREMAERELRKSKNLFYQVKMNILNSDHFIFVKEKIADIRKYVQNLLFILNKDVYLQVNETYAILSMKKFSNITFQPKLNMISNNIQNINLTLERAKLNLEDANYIIINNNNFTDLSIFKISFENFTEQVNYKYNILSRLNPEYHVKYVLSCQEHALKLQNESNILARICNLESAEIALKASTVYKDIIEFLDHAYLTANNASSVAQDAYLKVNPKAKYPLSRRLQEAKEKHINIMNEAEFHLEYLKELQNIMLHNLTSFNKTRKLINDGFEMINDMNNQLKKFEKGTENLVKSSLIKQNMINEKINKYKIKVQNITSKYPEIYDEINNLENDTFSEIVIHQIQQSQKDLTKAKIKQPASVVLFEKIKYKHKEVFSKLKALKDKILLARQKASSIRISLTTDESGICVRSFQPDVEPTTTNHILINFAIKDDVRDSLLFFLASSKSDDFMAVEMINRKIRFLWNAGGGTRVISHNLTIETNDYLLKNEYWYKIEVTRIGNTAKLKVQPYTDGQLPDPWEVEGTSPIGFSKMDFDYSSHLYVGGLPKLYQAPRELKTQAFFGCLYEIILDGKHIALWNFLTNFGCDGCKEGVTEQADENIYQFKGDGYAILPQIHQYNNYMFLVTFQFKTFDEYALLFFVANNKTGHFISLELQDGHIVYQFDLGNTSRLLLKTIKKYNNGNWSKLIAIRDMLQGQLSVDDDLQERKLPKEGPTSLELGNSLLYFGGTTPDFDNNRWSRITFQNYLGCMKDLQIDTTILNLFNYKYYGIESNCKDTDTRIVSFRGTGFIEIISQPLYEEGSFGFTFQSKQTTSLLMISTFEGFSTSMDKQKHYYYVILLNGKIEAHFNANAGEVKITSKQKFNDGTYHALTVIKRNRKITMMIDDNEIGVVRMPKGSKNIEAADEGGLFFGGVPEELFLGNRTATREPFKGVIKDVIFNNKLIQFNNPIRFKGVGIGHGKKYYSTFMGPSLPSKPSEHCAEMTSYALEKQALQFGNKLNSYAKLYVERTDFGRDYNITFDFRSFYSNGLIVLLRNRRRNSYFAILLLRKHIIVDMRDKKHKRLRSQGFLSNGAWHNVTVTKIKRNLTLSVDNDRISHIKVRRKLALRSPLYMGGIPNNLLFNYSMILKGFKGCIRNFRINGRNMNMSVEESVNVGHCFSHIELGAYFGGDAYAIYDNKFNLGSKLEVQLLFKTTQNNGILLSISESSRGSIFGIELFKGNIIVSMNTAGMPLQAIKQFENKYKICDGDWHLIIVQFLGQEVNLKVDKYDVVYSLGGNNLIPELSTAIPLFIGGLPDNEPLGVLNSRENFKGCIKNIAINNKLKDWLDMFNLKNVLPNSCPVF